MNSKLLSTSPSLLLLLLLAAPAAPASASAPSYSQCHVQADCSDKSYPICLPLWSDTGLTQSADTKEPYTFVGVCVQCTTDFDCDLDQYCAQDLSLSQISGAFENLGKYIAADQAKVKQYYGVYKDLKIRSICKKRELPDGHDDLCNTIDEIRQGLVSNVYENKIYNNSYYVYSGYYYRLIHERNKNRFCGKFIPNAFQTSQEISCINDGTGTCSKEKTAIPQFYQAASICLPESVSKDLTIQQKCMESGTLSGGGFSFYTSVIDWQGHCVNNKCYDCLHGDTYSGSGKPRVCVNGKWKLRYDSDMLGYEQGYDMLKENIHLQTQIAITVFAALCWAVAVWCAVLLMTKPAMPAQQASAASHTERAGANIAQVVQCQGHVSDD
ncbi:hypothetical protein GUITHDRAFT_106987 [Guillardia theta CCMP2712]|uniref:Uncharacterized protein n=1 Tax=Guillardia theta (strain CCMP2712) TaxID=905079 RepID=L1JFH3_GUITC|nr:hypothetical protein GUITHDRAFT_106987 [Guillardia theta CCMP2712]EKX47072.1 hypothetical protein GUITHDRAFT_106987 [Guillardia theta CCMP2712]|eukprot:XP_005834052.1 hypothetical protein GUITHDRAFT_106987 [Guillardia theta CCMP2712]